MAVDEKRITGTVDRRRVAPGSKSERMAVVLRADDGGEYVLRRMGGNAFRDPTLDALVGETITGTGLVTGHTFIMTDWVKGRG